MFMVFPFDAALVSQVTMLARIEGYACAA